MHAPALVAIADLSSIHSPFALPHSDEASLIPACSVKGLASYATACAAFSLAVGRVRHISTLHALLVRLELASGLLETRGNGGPSVATCIGAQYMRHMQLKTNIQAV